jgi:hypothetical protein
MDKQTTIIIVEDDTALKLATKSLIESMNEGFAIESEAKANVFEIHNYHQPMKDFYLKPQVEHGAYRQFIKRDKRKNFKLK